MSRSHLIPTVVVDKNNKTTTVHKRNGPTTSASSKLSGLKPKLAVAPKPAVSKVTFSGKTNGARLVTTSASFFLARSGLAEKAQALLQSLSEDRSVEMPDELLYDYLRLGIKPAEAAVIHEISGGDLDALKEDPQFASALPGDLAVTRHWGGKENKNEEIGAVVDFLAEAGIKPSKISAVLSNNLNDKRFENNVLTPEQLTDLFNRYTYSVSTDEKKGTNASRTMDAVMDGRLPFEMVDKSSGIDTSVVKLAADVFYPRLKRHRDYLPEAMREEMINDPELLVSAAQVASAHKLHWEYSFKLAYESIKEFGVDSSMSYNPKSMLKTHSDGTLLGPEGTRNAEEIIGQIRHEVDNDRIQGGSSYMSLGPSARDNVLFLSHLNKEIELKDEDISDLVRAGGTKDQIVDLIYNRGLDTREAMGVIVGDTIPNLAEGWL